MLSGKCFQAYLPSHIQPCWNNQMLYHLYLGRAWLTAANYCSICCPQQLLVWITPAGMEGHSLQCTAVLWRQLNFQGRPWETATGTRTPHIKILSQRLLPPYLTQQMAWTPWLWASPGQPRLAGGPGPAHVVPHGKEKVVTSFFLLHPSAAETEPSSVVLDVSFCFPPSLLLQ